MIPCGIFCWSFPRGYQKLAQIRGNDYLIVQIWYNPKYKATGQERWSVHPINIRDRSLVIVSVQRRNRGKNTQDSMENTHGSSLSKSLTRCPNPYQQWNKSRRKSLEHGRDKLSRTMRRIWGHHPKISEHFRLVNVSRIKSGTSIYIYTHNI